MRYLIFFAVATSFCSCINQIECECYDEQTETTRSIDIHRKKDGNCRHLKEGMIDEYPEGFLRCTEVPK